MEQIFGSHPVRSTIPGIQEVHGQVDWYEGQHGEVYIVTGEGDGQVRSKGFGRPWVSGSTDSKVSGVMKPVKDCPWPVVPPSTVFFWSFGVLPIVR